jgi:DNA-binding MarR family transcriptional regulator
VNRQDKVANLEKSFRTVFRKFKYEINNLLGEEISTNEFIVLKFLAQHGPRRVTDISNELVVSASHITVVTDALVKKGFISRHRPEGDRRVVQITLTEKGKATLEELEVKKSAYMKSRFHPFTDVELDSFLRLMKKLEE